MKSSTKHPLRYSAASHGRIVFALLAVLVGASACASGPDAISGELDSLYPADSVQAELKRPGPDLEPDYTAEELEALANSPQVLAQLMPFEVGPQPDRQLHVTMSDGIRIAVSLYFPVGLEAGALQAPTAYVETWYTRANEATGTAIELYQKAGFVVAIADPRGFGASFGSQSSYLSDRQRQDEGEVIAWLAAQPWSNGQVAATGTSVSAMLAEAMLAGGAPNLKAGIVRATEFDQYSQNLFPGGIPNTHMHALVANVLGWMRGEPCVADLAACPELGIPSVDGDDDFRLLQAAMRDHASHVAPDALASVVYSDDRVGTGTALDVSPAGHVQQLQRYAVPTRVSASWTDGTTAQGALDRFRALPDVPMEISIGATTHMAGLDTDPFSREAFGSAKPDASRQFGDDIAFLKRVLAGASVERKIDYYVLGAGDWKTTRQWPPAGVSEHVLHLSRNTLTRIAHVPAGERKYTVDPTASTGPLRNRWASQDNHAVYYGDRRFAVGKRVAFDGEPARSDLELSGSPELCLALRTDQTDGAVFAYLEDVAPDGRVTYLTEGELRLLHRKTSSGGCDGAAGTVRSFKREDATPVTPGAWMELEIPFWPVAARIEKGHRIRLSLAGADTGTFPMLTDEPATWSIGYGGKHGSTLSLPMKAWSAN